MNQKESILLQLIEMIYGAVEDPSIWPSFLRELADVMRGGVAAIYVHDIESAEGNCVWSARVDPSHLNLYDEYYHSKNIWTIRAKHLLAPGRIMMSHEVCSDSEVLKTEYYSDFLQPMDVLHNIGATLLRDSSRVGMLTVTRPRRACHFGMRELVILQALMPHLQRALKLQRQLSVSEWEGAVSSEILDRLHAAVFVVKQNGEVQVLNRAAQRLLDEDDSLTLGLNGFKASHHGETFALSRLIEDSMSKRNEETRSGGSMLISRKSPGYPLEVMVSPLRSYVDLLGGTRTSVLVLVVDPSVEPQISPKILRQIFSLSKAEANFVQLLTSGKNLSDVADELCVSMNTARTHLKSVMMKIGVRRQAEVILRVLRSSAVFDA
jgi:DNA-binding CsgD family transcriptional regulator/PAS domain-containing protein